MTSESYIIILILVLLLLKYLISTDKKATLITLKKSLVTLPTLDSLFLLILSVVATMWIAHQVIGTALIIGVSWVFFKKLFKSIGYELLTWWSFIIFLAYLLASYLGMENIPNQTILYLTLFSWGLSFILILVFDILKKISNWLLTPVAIIYSWAILILPLNYISYFITFNNPLNTGQINAIFQTTLSESIEFFQEHGAFSSTACILFFILSVAILILFQVKKTNNPLSGKVFGILAVAVLFITSLNIIPNIPTIELVLTSIEKYETEIAKFRQELEKRKSGDINFTATKEESNDLLIVVIGESLNKNHMGVYGYLRNTTPQLSKLYADSNLIKFDQAFSNHVHTVPTLTFALTEATQTNHFGYNSSLSILDIQDQAGFNTYWISNQVAVGGWDNPISVIAERAQNRINLNTNIGLNTNTSVFDNQIVNKLKRILEKPISKNTVIYIHLMGNHGRYKNRYPKEFKFYKEPFKTKNFGSKDYWYQHINEYDNSVLYNDFILSEIINVANNQSGNTACIYFADHSEDVLENNGHDEGNFTYPMAQIPMILWFSDSYKLANAEKIETIKNHQNQLFSNGFIYDFLIGVSDIKTDHYSPKQDPSNPLYKLEEKDSYTLHGTKRINANENYFFHEKKNLEIIKNRDELDRIFPHRTNTIGALSTILYDGCTSYEIDLVFQGTGDTSYFEVGHGKGEMSGMKFEEVLEFGKDFKVQKIWLDIKNLNEGNLSSVLNRLNQLDVTYTLKPKVIVETSLVNNSFSKFSQEGYHTSYYIPTHYNEYDKANKIKVAEEIAQQVIAQNLSAVSFDFTLYSFVKDFIEPRINVEIEYHTWNIFYGFQQHDLISKLDNSDYYKDSRVKTILVKYKNNFEL